MRFTSPINLPSSATCCDHFNTVRTKESDMNWNPTQNSDCPAAGELEGIAPLRLDTEVAPMIRPVSKMETQHD